MQRLIITGPCKTEFEDIPTPKCSNDGILVKTLVTAISTGTEIRVYRWIPVDDEGKMLHGGVPFPKDSTENGYSMIGEVIEVGKDVKDFNLGDRVFLGETHKEYAAVKADQAIKIPNKISIQELSNRMAERSSDIIKFLFNMKVVATINHIIDKDTAEYIVKDFGHKPLIE